MELALSCFFLGPPESCLLCLASTQQENPSCRVALEDFSVLCPWVATGQGLSVGEQTYLRSLQGGYSAAAS